MFRAKGGAQIVLLNACMHSLGPQEFFRIAGGDTYLLVHASFGPPPCAVHKWCNEYSPGANTPVSTLSDSAPTPISSVIVCPVKQ